MSRTANEKRPGDLRQAIVRYLVQHGLADLSLRPLARAVGSSPRVLLYYFGSKEKMIVDVLAEVRRQQRRGYAQAEGATFVESCETVWKQMSASRSEPFFRLFFEAYGIALRHPRLYKGFLHDTIEDWLQLTSGELCRQGLDSVEARAFATVVVAGLRGFMLDLCTTGDRKRLNRAVHLWLSALGSLLETKREHLKK